MKSKISFRFLLIFSIMLGLMNLLATPKVQASTINDYNCKIEKGDYIVYNNYFNTNDVKIDIYNDEETVVEISKENIDVNTFNNIVNSVKSKDSEKILVKIDDDVTSVRIKDTTKDLEIVEQNSSKYVVIDTISEEICEQYSMVNSYYITLEISKGEVIEEKPISVNFMYYNTDYFYCDVNLVSATGVVYGRTINTNGIIFGIGVNSIPSNLDLNKCYVEYLTNIYIGESIDVVGIGNVSYVGKYGDKYKYKTSLEGANISTSENMISVSNFSYNESFEVEEFYLDPDYIIENETYVENVESNTNTELKTDLSGTFNGTLKVEEINSNDLMYNKVDEELKKYDNNNSIYKNISNIYIENGSYNGALNLIFYVGEKYNGKNYSVVHMKDCYYNFEKFEGIVKDGKIDVEVKTLSPFGISVFEEKTINSGDNKDIEASIEEPDEKDNSPKTGTKNMIGYVSLITIISMVGIIKLRKKIIC